MDSQDMTITYSAIWGRARECAEEAMPEFPKVSTVEAWEDYIAELESLEPMEIASMSAEWDWVIYYHRAMELCQAVPSDVLNDAESEWEDMGAYTGDTFGLHEFACILAAIIVEREIAEQVESVRDELLELANQKLEQLESE